MLEIFLLIHLGKKLAAKARRRGWAGWPWVILLILGWFGALLTGAIASSVAYLATHPGEQEAPLLLVLASAYGVAACVAACVATGLFVVVGFLPADAAEEDYDDDEVPPRQVARRAAIDPYAEHDRRYTDDDDEERRTRRR